MPMSPSAVAPAESDHDHPLRQSRNGTGSRAAASSSARPGVPSATQANVAAAAASHASRGKTKSATATAPAIATGVCPVESSSPPARPSRRSSMSSVSTPPATAPTARPGRVIPRRGAGSSCSAVGAARRGSNGSRRARSRGSRSGRGAPRSRARRRVASTTRVAPSSVPPPTTPGSSATSGRAASRIAPSSDGAMRSSGRARTAASTASQTSRREIATGTAQRRDALADPGDGLRGAGAADRVDAAERLVDHESECVRVGRGGDVLPACLFGRHVRQRPDDVARPRHGVVVRQARDAEVGELRSGAVGGGLGADDVRRLHVAMHDPPRVGVGEGVAQRGADPQHVAVGQRAVVLELRECPTSDELRDEHPAVVVASGLVQRHDRRVAQPCGGHGLARGALAGLVARALGVHRHALDRDVTVEVLVVGLVHDAHAAAAQSADQAVAAEDELAAPRGGHGSGGLVVHPVRVRRRCRVSSLHGQEMTG